jgi:hypothetical protein
MSDAQPVLAFILGGQTSTLDDKKDALTAAKGERPPQPPLHALIASRR